MTKRTKPIKVKGVAKNAIQVELKGIFIGETKVRNVYNEQNTIILETQDKLLTIGKLRQADLEFLSTLHQPALTAKVTGGGYFVYDDGGELVTHVLEFSDLKPHQQELVSSGTWRTARKNFGLNIEY